MYLSKIILNFKCLKNFEIKDSYGIHKFVYNLFPGEKRSFLFCDKVIRQGKEIIILSNEQPKISDEFFIQIKKVPENFLSFDRYFYQVKLNVCKKDKSGQIIPILGNEKITNWFISKQSKWGFTTVSPLEIIDKEVLQIDGKNSNMVLSGVMFSGVLKISDRDKFIHSVKNGIGRGKAFGFGLLQLKIIK